jgi:hypothetical protein
VGSNIPALTLILLSLLCSQFQAEKSAAGDSPPVHRSDIQVLVPPGMPVSITSPAIEGTEYKCKLTYQLTNNTNERLKRVRLSLEIYNPTSLQKRGPGDEDSVEVAPHSRIDRMLEFTGCMREDERAVLVVWEAESEPSVWKVDYSKLVTAVVRCLQGKPYSLPKASWWVAVEK